MTELDVISKISVWLIPALFAITVHEVAHGWVANLLGDRTALMLGRLTLNPLRHIDLFGTIILPAAMVILTGYMLGYAKPVPITPQNLGRPKRDMVLVAAAGPLANLLMAVIWVVLIRIGTLMHATMPGVGEFLIYSGVVGIFVNLLLLIFNLLPLPPLDGGRVLSGLLPGRWSAKLDKIEPFGIPILLLLLVSGLLGLILSPVIFTSLSWMSVLAGIDNIIVQLLVSVGILRA